MTDNLMESVVRWRLREKRGQVYCPDCMAKDLNRSPQTVKEAMDALAGLPTFQLGACPCSKGGIMYVGL
jgi:hypothetical protein